MPTAIRRPALLAVLMALCACVSLEEATIPRGSVRPDQRAVIMVYASPGPWVSQETESKTESAAKFLPGVGQVVQDFQDQQDLKAALDLAEALPSWPAAERFEALLSTALKAGGFPARPVAAGQAGLPPGLARRFNRAADPLEWRRRYLLSEPGEALRHRDYSAVLELDDALVVEVNLQYGTLNGAEGLAYPALASRTRLIRANIMRVLWSHDDEASDKADPKHVAEFKAAPSQFQDRLQKLLAPLAQKIAAALAAAIVGPAPAAGAPPAVAPAMPPPALPRPPGSAPERPPADRPAGPTR